MAAPRSKHEADVEHSLASPVEPLYRAPSPLSKAAAPTKQSASLLPIIERVNEHYSVPYNFEVESVKWEQSRRFWKMKSRWHFLKCKKNVWRGAFADVTVRDVQPEGADKSGGMM